MPTPDPHTGTAVGAASIALTKAQEFAARAEVGWLGGGSYQAAGTAALISLAFAQLATLHAMREWEAS